MLQLFANGQQLDTAGVKFNLTLKNPLFYRTRIEGDYAYDINLTKTDKNNSIFSFPARIERKNDPLSTVKIDAYYNGIRFIEQAVGLSKIVGGRINLNIGIGSGDLYYQIRNKLICDVDFGRKIYENYAAATVDLYNTISKNYPETDFNLPFVSFPVDPYLPIGTPGYHNVDAINYWDGSNFVFTDESLNKGIIVPMLYLRYVIKKLFAAFGYTVDDGNLFNKGYSDLLLFNLFNINGGIPATDDDTGYSWDITTIEYKHLLPECSISDFLIWFQNRFNVGIFIDSSRKNVKLKCAEDILFSKNYIDISNRVTEISSIEKNSYDGFVIEITQDALDKYLSSEYAEDTTYGGILEKVSDLPDLPIRFFKYYVLETNKFYIWYDFDPEWSEMSSTDLDFFKISMPGSNSFNITSKITTLWSGFLDDSYSLAGYSAYDWRKMQPVFTFYKGQQSVSPYRPYSAIFKGDKFLAFPGLGSGVYGTYDNHFKKWMNWIINRDKVVKIKMLMNPTDLSQFDFSELYRHNGIDYLVKDIKIPVNERSIGAATLECYKV